MPRDAASVGSDAVLGSDDLAQLRAARGHRLTPIRDRVVLRAVRDGLQDADGDAELLGDPDVGVGLHVDESCAEAPHRLDGLGAVDEVVARRDRDAVSVDVHAAGE